MAKAERNSIWPVAHDKTASFVSLTFFGVFLFFIFPIYSAQFFYFYFYTVYHINLYSAGCFYFIVS